MFFNSRLILGVLCLFALFLAYSGETQAKENPKIKKNERYYQIIACEKLKGKIEVRLPTRQRVDCLTEHHAIEVDFASKYNEAVGQALDYARQTKLRAGIVLIVRSHKDQEKISRLLRLIKYHKLAVDVWVIRDNLKIFLIYPE